jgi:prefoldin subunit 5
MDFNDVNSFVDFQKEKLISLESQMNNNIDKLPSELQQKARNMLNLAKKGAITPDEAVKMANSWQQK